MSTYSFGYGQKADEVEIPELDVFLLALFKVCKKHGVGMRVECSDYAGGLVLTSIDLGDWGMFTQSLDEYEGGVPFLDAAKIEWQKRKADREAANRKQRDELAVENRKRCEDKMRQDGLLLSDGRYRLVKETE